MSPSRPPHPSAPWSTLDARSANRRPSSGTPTGQTGDLPAFDEFASEGSTDLVQVLPAELLALDTPQRQYVVRVLAGPETGLSRMVEGEELVLGRGRECDMVFPDSALSRRHCRVIRTGDGLAVEDLGSSNGTFLDGQPVQGRRPLDEGSRLQIGRHTLGIALQDQLEHQASRQLYEFSMRDPLTGIHNRRYFDQRLDEEFSYALRHRSGLAVLILDLDFFKRINDTWGHPVGDVVLRHAAEAMQRCVRKEDVLARFGGEEFAVLGRIQLVEGARALGERMRRFIERTSVAHQGQVIAFTASVGIASVMPDRRYESAAALLAAADKALYRAKAGGRNRCADDTDPSPP